MNQAFVFSLPNPSPQLQACIIIPARDEAVGIESTLNCFASQRDLSGQLLDTRRFEILLLANNCSDQTAKIARNWSKNHPKIMLHVVEANLHGEAACVGYARRLLMDNACHRLKQASWVNQQPDKPRAICSTDADTLASPLWIANTIAEMQSGAKAVGGRIYLKQEAHDPSRHIYLLDTGYRLLKARLEAKLDPRFGDPSPRHFQFFGASLAICPELYSEIGGLPKVQCLEDMALEQELIRRDIEIRHSPHVSVWTSARRDGRVQMGLSTQLSEWNELNRAREAWLVPSGEEIAFKARLQRRLRGHWLLTGPQEELKDLAAALMICPVELEAKLKTAPFFGELWGELWNSAWSKPEIRASFPPISVQRALHQLRQMLEGIREK